MEGLCNRWNRWNLWKYCAPAGRIVTGCYAAPRIWPRPNPNPPRCALALRTPIFSCSSLFIASTGSCMPHPPLSHKPGDKGGRRREEDEGGWRRMEEVQKRLSDTFLTAALRTNQFDQPLPSSNSWARGTPVQKDKAEYSINRMNFPLFAACCSFLFLSLSLCLSF